MLETQPGFYLDESAGAYNAALIARSGIDETGKPWPLYFRFYGEYDSPVLIYLMAAVFKVVGPSILAARLVGALALPVTAGVLGWLAVRITGRGLIGLITAATTLLTPWLFETSRLVLEACLMAPLLATFLLVLWRRQPDVRWSWPAIVALAGLLALVTYTYTLGRFLGPLLAAGLLLYLRRDRWTNVARTWAVYVLALTPILAYAWYDPASLFVRAGQTGYLTGLGPFDAAARFSYQFLANVDPRGLLLLGDRVERHHVAGVMGPLLVATLILAIVGLDRIAHRLHVEPFWRYVVFGLIASIVPASLTVDVGHALRLIGLPVFLIVLTIPAQAWLLEEGPRAGARRAVFGTLVAATMLQGAYFQVRFHQVAPLRGVWFDDSFPGLLDEALATGAAPIYLVDGIAPPYLHAYWYGLLRGVPQDRFIHVLAGQSPPSGAIVVSGEGECKACTMIDARGFFKLYQVR